MSNELVYSWRDPISDDEMVELVGSHGGRPEAGWWDQIRPHSLGWVAARTSDALLVGFVNITWDGGDHAFLLDTRRAASGSAVVLAPKWSAAPPSTRKQLDASGYTSTSSRTFGPSTSMPAASVRRTLA